MDFYKLTRQAHLLGDLHRIYEIKIKDFSQLKNYYEKQFNNLSDKEDVNILNANILVNLISYFEAYLSDILIEIICAYPNMIDLKEIKIQTIRESNNITNTIRKSAEEYCNKIFFSRISKILKIFKDKHDFKDFGNIDNLEEFWATRNIIIHNRARVDKSYIYKSGNYARNTEVGRKIGINYDYIISIFDILINLSDVIYNSRPYQTKELTRAKVFRIYWENSILQKSLAFKDAWILGNEIFYPTDKLMKRSETGAFSHSECDMVYFFWYIYGTNKYAKSEIDIRSIDYHFSPESKDKKIVTSWLESPFFL